MSTIRLQAKAFTPRATPPLGEVDGNHAPQPNCWSGDGLGLYCHGDRCADVQGFRLWD